MKDEQSADEGDLTPQEKATRQQQAIVTGRRWLRLSIRTVFVLMLVCAIGFAWYSRRLREDEASEVVPTTWDIESGKNVKWRTKLGSVAHATPLVSGGKIFIGTNNQGGYIPRFPKDIDLGVLLCLDEKTGKFLWQASNKKLDIGRVGDWPLQGVCSTPRVEKNRLWYVTNRCEVVCLDTEGFYDGENDGPYKSEKSEETNEADIVWKFDMRKRLGVFPHNMSASSIVVAGPRLFVVTGNGVGETHLQPKNPAAPSFLCLHKETGAALWYDNSPGANILHGSWGSPTYSRFKGVPQVIFPGGDGWLYSFDPRGQNGKSKLLWKFDCNPKSSKWQNSRGNRNNLLRHPVIYRGRIYVSVGQEPEHGEGEGHLWCIDPNRRGDVSPRLVYHKSNTTVPMKHRRQQAFDPNSPDESTVPNPNSAVIWEFHGEDTNKDGKLVFEERFHRCLNSVAIKNDLVIAADFSGLVHCFNAESGKRYWTHDVLANVWAAPLIAGEHVFVADADGDVAIYKLSRDPQVAMKNGHPIAEIIMPSSVYATPVVSKNVLFIANRSELFAIHEDGVATPNVQTPPQKQAAGSNATNGGNNVNK